MKFNKSKVIFGYIMGCITFLLIILFITQKRRVNFELGLPVFLGVLAGFMIINEIDKKINNKK